MYGVMGYEGRVPVSTRAPFPLALHVDIAIQVAQKAYETSWGLNVPGLERANILWKLAQLMEANAQELAALEALDNGEGVQELISGRSSNAWAIGKTFGWASGTDVTFAINVMKYYAGWADKVTGKTLEV
jgi:aldehyde dehydrogenase (NAD+)